MHSIDLKSNLLLQTEAILTFKKFLCAVREGSWGEDISYNSFDEKLWDELLLGVSGWLKSILDICNFISTYLFLCSIFFKLSLLVLLVILSDGYQI